MHVMDAVRATIPMKAHPRPTPEVKSLSRPTEVAPMCSCVSAEQSRLRVLTGHHHHRSGPSLKPVQLDRTRSSRGRPCGWEGGVSSLATRCAPPSGRPSVDGRLPAAPSSAPVASLVRLSYDPDFIKMCIGTTSHALESYDRTTEVGSPNPSLPILDGSFIQRDGIYMVLRHK